ncbi:MAG TPA: SIS domain-containing protein [Desulfomonilaceae bacterium]|nr:SIS domain-containing protein [Desulfomonilaceae bacterium]
MDGILQEFENLDGSDHWDDFAAPLKDLLNTFSRLMSFGFHYELVRRAPAFGKMERIAEILDSMLDRLTAFVAEKGHRESLDTLAEDARDCLWQIREEVLGNVGRTLQLMPDELKASGSRSHHFVAWAVEQVMENLDRLEVRGRDSAGVSIECLVPETFAASYPPEYEGIDNSVKTGARATNLGNGQCVYTFVYKIANLVGRLGDNTAGLRHAIREDELLWQIGSRTEQLNIVAHTRWASNGIISLSNCHPADGTLYGREHEESSCDRLVQFVLNGDVDNYKTLVDRAVVSRNYQIDPAITTDAKILPVFYRLGTTVDDSPENRFATLLNSCEGSLAIVMQHPQHPHELYLGQKGSGQSLFAGKIEDGFILASEVYGLAARTRQSYALSGTERGGTRIILCTIPGSEGLANCRYLEDGQPFHVKPEPIYIHSRDIYRGQYNYYFEKEIHEAPSSIRKTIKAKYRKMSGRIDFAKNGQETFGRLLSRLRDSSVEPIRRIMVIGQGTASVAAMGVAHLIDRALARARIIVDWCKASEMSGFLSEDSLHDMLLVAISQSGTTTDTNRTVDVAGSQGAWIHAIVNRRNSPLVAKSNSYSYTSDGRDVEMAVASTKAFYSQIAAGKLLALLLAQEFRTMSEEEIHDEILELEKLPHEIESVLAVSPQLRECAEKYGPSSRNWAVVGNGPNKIAADEIRIKLSELCYKSIPCDFTEDKKHIDLSTEPLTLVIANDLPERLVQDTAKEVAIFKAHNGKPIVFCARGEQRFNEYAEQLIELPPMGAGLGFVLATVAGHLWGFHTARAIDARAEEFRHVRSLLTSMLEEPGSWNQEALQTKLWSVIRLASSGELNASLPASTAASLALYTMGLGYAGDPEAIQEEVAAGIGILNKAIEEMTRPVDTIRHQAKTVTVGISRPQEILPPVLLNALESIAALPGQVKEHDRRMLRLVSSIISDVPGALYYEMAAPAGDGPWIQATRRSGACSGKPSRYDRPRSLGGSKRTALRLERAIWSAGPDGAESLLIIPLFHEELHDCTGIALFHVSFHIQASIQQKLTILRGLGTRYHDLVERLEEVSSAASLEEILDSISPRDLILAPIDHLIPDRKP